MNLDPLQRRVTDSDVDRIFDAVECIRKFDEKHGSHEISISAVASLLYVGSREGAHKQALEEDLVHMSKASSSRTTDILSKWHRLVLPNGKRRPGLELIKKEVDAADGRRSVLTLTKKGEELITQLKEIIYGET